MKADKEFYVLLSASNNERCRHVSREPNNKEEGRSDPHNVAISKKTIQRKRKAS